MRGDGKPYGLGRDGKGYRQEGRGVRRGVLLGSTGTEKNPKIGLVAVASVLLGRDSRVGGRLG